MDAAEVEAAVERLARDLEAAGTGEGDMMLVGIRRRGVELAALLASALERRAGRPVPTGTMDITLYRDDFRQVGPRPVIGTTELPGPIDGRRVVIVDDVLYTGRTVRAALDQLADFGRARRVELCVLVDRGGRELPIQPDHVGATVEVPEGWEVAVRVPALDDELSVALVPVEAAP